MIRCPRSHTSVITGRPHWVPASSRRHCAPAGVRPEDRPACCPGPRPEHPRDRGSRPSRGPRGHGLAGAPPRARTAGRDRRGPPEQAVAVIAAVRILSMIELLPAGDQRPRCSASHGPVGLAGSRATSGGVPAATIRPPSGPAPAHVDEIVGGGQQVQVVIDDDDRRPGIEQAAEHADQGVHVHRVQAGGRLVKGRSVAGTGRSRAVIEPDVPGPARLTRSGDRGLDQRGDLLLHRGAPAGERV